MGKRKDNIAIMMLPLLILMVVVSLFVVGMIVKIQLVDKDRWEKQAAEEEHRVKTDYAHRGTIYSSDGKVLAVSEPEYDLIVDFHPMKELSKNGKDLSYTATQIKDGFSVRIDTVCGELSAFTGKPVEYYKRMVDSSMALTSGDRGVVLEKSLPYSLWHRIAIRKGWRKVVITPSLETNSVRFKRRHINENLAKNCIGFRNSVESNTYTGLEGMYDSVLRGIDGKYYCRRLNRGIWQPDGATEEQVVDDSIAKKVRREKVDGHDIVATIDTRFQDVAEASLRRMLMREREKQEAAGLSNIDTISGCAILMEVSTGYVAACVSLSWDPQSQRFLERPDRNIAASTKYEPGSTFKTVILTAMMNDPKLHLDTAQMVEAKAKVFSKYQDKPIEGLDTYDSTPVSLLLPLSSNVGMCALGWNNYRERRQDLKDEVEAIYPYGALNLDIKATEPKTDIVKQVLRYDVDFLNFCYGYSTTTTPMQLATFYNALANGGKMVKPLFCRAIVADGERMEMAPVVLNERISSDENLAMLRSMMVQTMEHPKGTGRNFKSPSYTIAGKTGTAVFRTNERGMWNASFAGYFPASNPRYTCVVMILHTPNHGATAALPVFREIADCVMSLDHQAKSDKVEPLTGSRQMLEGRYVKPVRGGDVHKMPNCKGMTVREAMEELHRRGLKVTFTGYGRVVSQSMKAGSPVAKGEMVSLELRPM